MRIVASDSFVRIVAIFVAFLALSAFAQRADAPQVLDTDAEQEIFRLVNLERARAGLPSLRLDPNLQKAARAHSRIMADAHQLSHEFGAEPRFDTRLALAGASFDASGENVAFNVSAEGAHRGLMNSPPHRKNILDPRYNAVGVGVVRVGDDVWVTQDFTRAIELVTPLEARNQVIATFQQARRSAHLLPVEIVNEPRLQSHACRMAKDGALDSKTPLAWSTIRSATTYSESDLTRLPSTAAKLAIDPSVKRISVGVCFDKSPAYVSGMYWVGIAAY